MVKKIRIASRQSKLALWQANHVAKLLKKAHLGLEVEIIGIVTNGDKIAAKSLNNDGGKGLFIKELEAFLLANMADIAVHSLKDMPSTLDEKFLLSAILPREDARDAFLSNKYEAIDKMPNQATIGTSSVRRRAFLKKYYPQLNIKLLRGNVDTRLKRLDNGEYDAIILAAAGLKRLGLESRITAYLDQTKFIPAIAQGAIGIEILAHNVDLYGLTKLLNHEQTAMSTKVERLIGAGLGASCDLPIAIHANISDRRIKVVAIVLDENGATSYYAKCSSSIDNHIAMVSKCVNDLKSQGVENILARYQ